MIALERAGWRAWRGRLLCALLCWCWTQANALKVVDDRGVTVAFDRAPARIVSVLPSLTEMVCALGQCQRLVGVDRYSNFPHAVRALPKVGGGLDPNIETIVALKADVVLLATSSPMAARLESLGVKVLALEPKTHADVRRVLEILGSLLEVPDALRVWQQIDAGMAEAARALPAARRGLRIYFEVNNAPYAASESSFIGETLTRLGLGNVVPAALGPFPKINPEFVVRANPDLIMVGDAAFAGMSDRPGWRNMAAIKSGKVCVFSPEQSDVIVRPGPRMADAARYLVRCVLDKLP